MTTKAGMASLYSVAPSDKADSLLVDQVGTTAAIKKAYASLTPLAVQGTVYLLGYDPGANQMDAYRFTNAAPWLQSVAAKVVVGTGWDVVEPCIIGNQPYLTCYAAKKGMFHLLAVNADLSLSKPYEYYRNHEPGISQGFTTLKSFASQGRVVFLGYNGANGYVAMYTLAVTTTSPPNTPPLALSAVWSHQWAKGWTRFAFFQFGGENFFLKTNTWKPNVNIDHVLDDPAAGTVEVGTSLRLKDAQDLQDLQPFVLKTSDPYFVTYKKDGAMTINRFRSDCLGWTTVASWRSRPAAKHVVPLTVGGQAFLLIV